MLPAGGKHNPISKNIMRVLQEPIKAEACATCGGTEKTENESHHDVTRFLQTYKIIIYSTSRREVLLWAAVVVFLGRRELLRSEFLKQ